MIVKPIKQTECRESSPLGCKDRSERYGSAKLQKLDENGYNMVSRSRRVLYHLASFKGFF